MLVPPLGMRELALFCAEENFQNVVDILARNRQQLQSSGRLLQQVGERYLEVAAEDNADPHHLRIGKRILQKQTEIWVGDYLKRRQLLQLLIDTDRELRFAQNLFLRTCNGHAEPDRSTRS